MNCITAARRILVLALVLSATACYTQRPLPAPVPAPATRIVAELTDPGTVALSDAIGPGALEIEAVVAAANSDSWNLQMLRVEHRDGRSIPWNREIVTFPRTALTKVMEKRLDKTKSWIAAGAITAAALIAARMFNLIGAGEGTGGEPVPQEAIIPGGGIPESGPWDSAGRRRVR